MFKIEAKRRVLRALEKLDREIKDYEKLFTKRTPRERGLGIKLTVCYKKLSARAPPSMLCERYSFYRKGPCAR
jgi:hypothetical protein